MAVFTRRGKWAVTTYDPASQGKAWVGTYETKREAQDAEHAARFERRKGRRAEETVDAFAARWVDDHPRQPATNISNRERISKFARDFNGRRLNDIDRQEARAWALANPSRVAVVRSMFSDAVRDGVCESNPFLGLRLRQSRGRKDLEIPSDEQFEQLVTAAKQLYPGWGEHVFSHMIVFAAYTGLRPGELAGVRWDDVDFRRERLRVERQYNSATRSFAEPKFGGRRTIFLAPPAAQAVRSTARVRDEVFSSPQGAILSRKLLAEYFKPVANSVGLTGWTPHCLRHAYGSRLARLGLDAFTIAKSMGHRDNGRVAMERYIHWSERDAFNRTARAFGSSQREFRLLSGAEREQDAQESQS